MYSPNDRKMDRKQVEAISLFHARSIVKGTDNLKSSGRKGKVFLPRLRRMIKYRSLLEMTILKELDVIPEVVDLQGEPLIINYFWKGVTLCYVPDLIVKLFNGKVWILEIKPASQIDAPRNKAKFTAAREFCRTHGDHLRFGVLTNLTGMRKFLASHNGIGMLEQKIQERREKSHAR